MTVFFRLDRRPNRPAGHRTALESNVPRYRRVDRADRRGNYNRESRGLERRRDRAERARAGRLQEMRTVCKRVTRCCDRQQQFGPTLQLTAESGNDGVNCAAYVPISEALNSVSGPLSVAVTGNSGSYGLSRGPGSPHAIAAMTSTALPQTSLRCSCIAFSPQ